MNTSVKITDIIAIAHRVEGIRDEDYDKVEFMVQAASAFERSVYQSVFIVNYHKSDLLYVSSNFCRIYGVDADRMTKLDYRTFDGIVSQNELKQFLDIRRSGFKFFNILPNYDKLKHSLSYNLHLNIEGKKRMVNITKTPLILNDEGKIWLEMCVISLATGKVLGNAVITKSDSTVFYEYVPNIERNWIERPEINLNEYERDVLILSAQGNAMHEIAKTLHRSVDSIKSYKRSIFKKMAVNNISEAITYAHNHHLI